jgi:hypothetical protein
VEGREALGKVVWLWETVGRSVQGREALGKVEDALWKVGEAWGR